MNDSPPIYVHPVAVDEDGITVRALLYGRLRLSRTMVRKLKGCQGIRVDGRPERVTRVLRAGERVELSFPAPHLFVAPEPLPIDVIYEDEDLLGVNKPPGLVVHPAPGHRRGTLANGVAAHLLGQPGVDPTPRPIHRLDKDTSGAIAFAKHRLADQQLSAQLARGGIRREYLAVAAGLVPAPGTVDLPIAVASRGTVRPAVTHFDVLRRWPGRLPDLPAGASLLRVRLETGRMHQIRVHLSAIGHPLLGDARYGAPSALIGRQALHAESLELTHPRTKQPLRLVAPPPSDWTELLRRLGE